MNSTNSSAASPPRQVPGVGPGHPATAAQASARPPGPGALTPLEPPHLKATPPASSRHPCSSAAAAVLIGILTAYATTTSNAGASVERLRELLAEVVDVCGKLRGHAPICATAREHHRLTADFQAPVISTPTLVESYSSWLLIGSTLLILCLHLKKMRFL